MVTLSALCQRRRGHHHRNLPRRRAVYCGLCPSGRTL